MKHTHFENPNQENLFGNPEVTNVPQEEPVAGDQPPKKVGFAGSHNEWRNHARRDRAGELKENDSIN